MDFSVHLPLMDFGDQGLSSGAPGGTMDAARECGFAAVSANDDFVFSTPWLDGPTALAAMVERSGDMVLATTLSLAALRGPVPLAKALSALDVLSDGRVVASVGPALQGVTMTRWGALRGPVERLDEAIAMLMALLRGDAWDQPPSDGTSPHPNLGSRRRRGKPVVLPYGSELGLGRTVCAGVDTPATAGLPPRLTLRPSGFDAAKQFLRRRAGEARKVSSMTSRMPWSRCGPR